jgi:hypothetical protein
MSHFPTHLALLILIGVGSVGCYSPHSEDHARVNAIGQFIEARYGQFVAREQANRNHTGKTYYAQPARTPRIILYEVVTPAEIAQVETIAHEALVATKIPRVELVFYEKQIWHLSTGGGGSRGSENVVKRAVIDK